MQQIERPIYMDRLNQWRGKPVIKVITGVRRCGKSTVMSMFIDSLPAQGVAPERIQRINLDDPGTDRYRKDWLGLYNDVVDHLVPGTTNYVFLDEIQQVTDFQRLAAGLARRDDVDLYLTGSTSHLLAGQLATLLSGRYVSLDMLPLSFAEYISAHITPDAPRTISGLPLGASDLYSDYVAYGSMPGILQIGPNPHLIERYLDSVIDSVLLRDVVENQHISNVAVLRDVVAFLASNIGSLVSVKRISDTLASATRAASRGAIDSYLTGLMDAFIFYRATQINIRGTGLLRPSSKYYMVDPGLRRVLLSSTGGDTGHVLENVVYLELLRRGTQVSIGKVGSTEVDFVVTNGADTTYIQVAASVAQPDTLERELAPLKAIHDYNQRLLITLDSGPTTSLNGIKQVNALEWLLGIQG